ncbi:MAG: A/G-specific adenine glycosylase, partial [Oscillospiraceae bacterium]|nr:A/G-specific adenine glycosylase [Oscillospiraceae bacterium]
MGNLHQDIPNLLLSWYETARRDLPWRKDRQPYHVWLSEIMLQQTRVEAVKGYYERFLRELPTVEALASCEPDRLHKLWEGLGYYSRVKNLQKAAQTVVTEYGGTFPHDYDKIRRLAGIGDYTAGAIASICFDEPTPAVDGNVLRVLSRVTEDGSDILLQKTKKDFAERLQNIYPKGRCGDFTQALMELGATVCVPNGEPHCEVCPLRQLCAANAHQTQAKYPVKSPKKEKKLQEKTVFVLTCDGHCAVSKRPDTGLLAGLWELPNIEGKCSAQQAISQAEAWGTQPKELIKELEKVHIFTHIKWEMRCFYIVCSQKSEQFEWVDSTRFDHDIA